MANIILPKPLNKDAMMRELRKGVDQFGDVMLADFEATVGSWEHEVKFERKLLDGASGITGFIMRVYTRDEIYIFVSGGTKPHKIRAKNAPRLVFPTGYTAKTKPGKIESGGGGSFGPIRSKVEVQHPGTEPRNFPKAIAEARRDLFRKTMLAAMQKAAKASGHGG